ncbi:hypothetical protein Q31a_32030 [Aureliella helgolandensis]|uniref:Uncharacterized protein n=1 Tax=Aureliella helgolandensis TaxID=2527968 RepID=A0A518G8H1_9BACT|nr:hypothetical protein Q31a_32030 [Aureliella helgolandensis]
MPLVLAAWLLLSMLQAEAFAAGCHYLDSAEHAADSSRLVMAGNFGVMERGNVVQVYRDGQLLYFPHPEGTNCHGPGCKKGNSGTEIKSVSLVRLRLSDCPNLTTRLVPERFSTRFNLDEANCIKSRTSDGIFRPPRV